MSLPWCRLYAEFAHDPKVQMMSEVMQRRYLMLLCLASSGTVPVQDDGIVSFALRISPEDCAVTKQGLVSKGLISPEWMPIQWESRQFKSDHDAAERKRKQRSRDKSDDGHGDVTTMSCESHATEQNRYRTEQNRKTPPAAPAGLDAAAWAVWLDYRRQIGKPLKPASIPAAQRKLAAFGTNQSAVVEQSTAQGWTGLFPVKQAANRATDGTLRVVV